MDKQQIQSLLTEHHYAFISMISDIERSALTTSVRNKWTPLQQLEHICKSVMPISKIMTSPEILKSFNFGIKESQVRDYEEIQNYYQEVLATGVKARGKFIPLDSDELDRNNLIQELKRTVAQLNQNIQHFGVVQLDTEVIPHPVLGKLSVREMLYFTIYHVQHHHRHTLVNLEPTPETH